MCSEPRSPISPQASKLYQQIAQVRRDLQVDQDIPAVVLRAMLLRSLEGMEILSQCVDSLGDILRDVLFRQDA